MLYRGGYIMSAYLIRVVALKAFDLLGSHDGVDQRVLSVVFPYTTPTRIAGKVNSWGICPRAVCSAGLISGDFSSSTGQYRIKRCTYVYVLREQYTTESVGCTVILIKTIYARDTDFFHRHFLDLANQLFPLCRCLRCRPSGGIKH